MKWTKEQEAAMLQVYNAYWDGYLKGDVAGMSLILDDHYTQVGSAESEVFFNKKDAVKFLHDTSKQVAGKAQMRNRSLRAETLDNHVLMNDLFDMYVLEENAWTFYSRFRASTLMKEINGQWKFVHQHASVPGGSTQHGENLATEKMAAENLQLRDAVKRHTIELEQKNRELEIEAALERMRAVAMSMQKPDDLLDICKIQFTELQQLGFKDIRNALIGIFNDEQNDLTDYDYSDFSGGAINKIPYNKNPLIDQSLKQMKSATDAFTEFIVEGEELEAWKTFRKENGEYNDTRITNARVLYYYFYSISQGYVGLSTFKKISEEQLNILKRIRNIFDLAYSKYVDISHAEAQAKEAKIEASLERMRAVAMSMQKPKQLIDVCESMFKELGLLGLTNIRNAQVAIENEERQSYSFYVYSDFERLAGDEARYDSSPLIQRLYQMLSKSGDAFYEKEYSPTEMEEWRSWRKSISALLDPREQTATTMCWYMYPIGKGHIGISTFDAITKEQVAIVKRFKNVFALSYRRFDDLQKAEAQAREASIEAALEKVRSRSLAMHKSEELQFVAEELLLRIKAPDIAFDAVNILVFQEDGFDIWSAYQSGKFIVSRLPFSRAGISYIKNIAEAKKFGLELFSHQYSFEEKNIFFKYLLEETGFKDLPDGHKRFLMQGECFTVSIGFAANTAIQLQRYSKASFSESENDIVKRFTKVFQQCYIRFLDLQKAEAQAREAQIEAALEKVRSRSMGMQKSEELKEVIQVVYEQFVQLKIFIEHTGFIMNYKERDDMHIWLADKNGVPSEINIPYFDSPHWNSFMEAKAKDLDFFANELNFEEKNKFYNDLFTLVPGISKEVKEYYASCPALAISTVLLDNIGLYIENFSGIPYSAEDNNTLMRFGKVFQQTYTRFLDLQKAETQSRENQIQLALERTRTQSMIMQHSNELDDILRVFHEQVLLLGIHSAFSFLWLPDEEKSNHIFWAAWEEHKNDSTAFKSKAITYPLDRNEPATAQCLVDWKSDEPVHSYAVKSAEVENYFAAWAELLDGVEKLKPEFFRDGLYYVEAFMKYGCFGVMLENDLSGEEKNILYRFSVEFERTYTRFLDLQKAEAQTREAQIEAALEKVRSRTMAMQRSDELSGTAVLLFQEFKKLEQQELTQITFGIYNESKNEIEFRATDWEGRGEQIDRPAYGSMEEPTLLKPAVTAWKTNAKSLVVELTGEALEGWVSYRNKMTGSPITSKDAGDRRVVSIAFFSKGHISLSSPLPMPIETVKTLERFAALFDGTYTRFLDLQKAEAQAREAQIEAALEKVRGYAMAMYNSNDLSDTAGMVFTELNKLGINPIRSGVGLISKEEKTAQVYSTTSSADGRQLALMGEVALSGNAVFENQYTYWLKKENYYASLNGAALRAYYKILSTSLHADLNTSFEDSREEFGYWMMFSEGFLYAWSEKKYTPAQLEILDRFKKVIELTFKRYLDLKKAEAQAREAQIEAALEKVRAVAMSMMKSDELLTICQSVFEQLQPLGFISMRSAQIYIRNDEAQKFLNYDYSDLTGAGVVEVAYNSHPNTKRIHDVIKSAGDALIDNFIAKEELESWKSYLYNTLGQLPEKSLDTAEELHYYLYSFGIGAFGISTFKSIGTEELEILKRFRNVFNLAYQRYTDISMAEAQAREAHIEAALERVRSRTLAMQKSDELSDTAAELFKQLISLGIAPNRLYIGITGSESSSIAFWVTDEDGSKVSTMFTGDAAKNLTIKKMYDGWKQQQKSMVIDMQGKELADYFYYLGEDLHVPFKEGLEQKRRIQYLTYFSKGFIGIASPDEQPQSTIHLLERFSYVFNLTFTRFNDLKIAEAHAAKAAEDLIKLQTEKKRAEDALTELQATQKQLIQSEKMASLGELTAGIAHEIQNPLNFVNNFSEVNKELIDELMGEKLKAKSERDEALENELLNDIKTNEEKINHHGKRADAIVKGMLQHSQSSTGTKELTDINALCDEYLRLSYHGLRTKDKSFNATINTDFDKSLSADEGGIGNINIIPQDIGRVILNLLTNAFYAVNEKKQIKIEGYDPMVSISTKKINDKVEIKIGDNGNGIPAAVKEKIFQPFFTTKPTGQGTGLGLSLSYDIIKAHGGEIKVETVENESLPAGETGSTFIIQLPTNQH